MSSTSVIPGWPWAMKPPQCIVVVERFLLPLAINHKYQQLYMSDSLVLTTGKLENSLLNWSCWRECLFVRTRWFICSIENTQRNISSVWYVWREVSCPAAGPNTELYGIVIESAVYTHTHTRSNSLSITLFLLSIPLYFLNCSFPPYSSGSIGTNAVEWLGGKVPSIYPI